MTEVEYRTLEIDSYSTLKVFIEDRKKYYRKFVLKEKTKDDETSSTKFGSLVDCLQFTPSEFDKRYTLAITQVPTGQYAKFVDQLMKVTVASLNEEGEVTRDLEDMMLDAYNLVKFDRDGVIVDFKRDNFEIVKQKFLGSQLEAYYRQLRESYGKTVIEMSELQSAENIVNELKTNPVTRDVITIASSEYISVHHQFPIVGKMIPSILEKWLSEEELKQLEEQGGYSLKALIDKLVVDHQNMVIYIYDLKTAWDNENEFLVNYFKYKYYLQMAVYFYLVVEWKKQQKGLENYRVEYPRFIVADSNNYKSPLIYYTNIRNFDQGMRGFILKGKYYSGVLKAISDLIWHKKEGIWSISKENFKNKGIVQIKPFE